MDIGVGDLREHVCDNCHEYWMDASPISECPDCGEVSVDCDSCARAYDNQRACLHCHDGEHYVALLRKYEG